MSSYEKSTMQSSNHVLVLWAALWEARKPEHHNYGLICQFLSKNYVTFLGYVNSAGRPGKKFHTKSTITISQDKIKVLMENQVILSTSTIFIILFGGVSKQMVGLGRSTMTIQNL